MHMCGNKGRPDTSTSARNCLESPASKSCLALGLDFPPHFKKAWEDEEDRYFFFLVMKKNDTQTASYTFCQYCLCFKSGEREMNAEDSGCATKKCVSLSKILYKKTLYRSFIAQSWLSGQYASKVVKSLLIHFKMITELKTPKTQS